MKGARMENVGKILVPVDFSECSREAMRYALMLARRLGAHVEALHVWTLPMVATAGDMLIAMPDQPYQRAADWMEREAQEAMDRFVSELDTGGLRVATRVEPGRAEETILSMANQGSFDLIVMGTHGRSGLSHLLMGSVAERVVRLASCPVMTVKAERAAA